MKRLFVLLALCGGLLAAPSRSFAVDFCDGCGYYAPTEPTPVVDNSHAQIMAVNPPPFITGGDDANMVFYCLFLPVVAFTFLCGLCIIFLFIHNFLGKGGGLAEV